MSQPILLSFLLEIIQILFICHPSLSSQSPRAHVPHLNHPIQWPQKRGEIENL